MDRSQLLLVLLLFANIHSGHTEERPKAKVTIKPDQYVFRGETVILRCDIDGEGVTSWQYSWYKDGSVSVFSDQEHTFWFVSMSDAGKYSCYGAERGGSHRSHISDAVTLTVSDRARAVLSVSPQKWLTEGDPVTLICEVYGSSRGWTFSWYTLTVSSDNRYFYKLLSYSSRGAGGNYTVSSAALKHTGVYVCRAERGKPAYETFCSNRQLIWVTDYSFPVFNLIISPNRTQHFSRVSLSLSCEDQSKSSRWRVRRYTDSLWKLDDCSSSYSKPQKCTESTCTISSTSIQDTGVYWCESKSGEYSHPVNITVHYGVILESPVHPVTEGDTLTLRCLYQRSTPPNIRADFYKDESLIQSQTTEMIISTVSKSHEGFYYCKHPERGESPKSWISVTAGLSAPCLTVKPQSSLFTGDSVTLRCEVNQSWDAWEFMWRKDSNTEFTEAANKTLDSVKVSDGGEYRCRARRGGHYTYYSKPVTVAIYERPKAKVTIKPDQHVFRGETVTLRCDIDGEGVISWQYSWYKDGSVSVFSDQEHTFWFVTESDAGKYSCYGVERGGSRTSNISDAVTLTVSGQVSISVVSPQTWLTEGDPMTLICEVYDSPTGWTFSWYIVTVSSDNRYHYKMLSDSSRGAGGNYTVSSAALNHTGVYVCRAERGKPAYETWYSSSKLKWVTDYPIPVSNLIISPSRTQHFTSVFLSLSCEDQSNSGRWTVRRYTDSWGRLEGCSSSVWASQTGSKCTINSTSIQDTGVYWCESKSGENSHPVNITIHYGVILESPFHPVAEGDTLTLRCLYEYTLPPYIIADFYKDESLIQSQTTEMIISTVSKSHEGFYYCKHPERGKSPKSWISVTERPKAKVTIKPDQHVFRRDTVTLRCDIDGEGVTSWQYSWYKDDSTSVFSELQEHTLRSVTETDAGKYSCYGAERGGSHRSQHSDKVTLTVSDIPKPTLTVLPQSSLFNGDSVTLRCEVDQSWVGMVFLWSKNSNNESTGAAVKTIHSVKVSDGGEYRCRAQRGKLYTNYSEPVSVKIYERPKAKVTINPDQHVFRGETVTLRCDIDGEGVTSWQYSWYKDGSVSDFINQQEHTFRSITQSDTAKYSCYGAERGGSRRSQHSDKVILTVSDIPKPTLTVLPQSSLFTGDSVTLRCEVDQSWVGRVFLWSKNSNNESAGAAVKTIHSVKFSDGGEYRCRARRGKLYTNYSEPVTVTIYEGPKAKVTIKPYQHVFRGETVTLRCDICGEGVTSWRYSWYKDGSVSDFTDQQEHTFRSVTESDTGKYSCYGEEREGSRTSNISDEVTLTVSVPRAVLSVSRQKWLTEGDPVTLICEVYGSSTGWTFSWYTLTVSSGVSPPVSLIISPSRTQHFTSVSLSLSCEDQSNSDRWTVRRYTESCGLEDCSSSVWGSQTGSTCTINSTSTSDTGVYWCESESGENSHPVNITVHCESVFLSGTL
ncbi:Fc receptor-like protein 5 isoform X3 [Labeo rohita]|uniref:Fc receptor-like protein 5 isoform X3 n=1 Tax=Labeo rohita TaxID=84645 RepID=UPI0021E2496F|nr:Fc receptor-like protein 5 isoform X3 [Labeo rohita]